MTFRRWSCSPSSRPARCDDACAAIAASYRSWARARALAVHEALGLRLCGSVAGRDVVVDPGIDSGAAGWVTVTVGVALAGAACIFVTRATAPTDTLSAAVRSLFDDEHLGAELRAISVARGYVRLRLAPGAAPDVVETAVAALARVVRSVYAPAPSEPRQSCATTVPYPVFAAGGEIGTQLR